MLSRERTGTWSAVARHGVSGAALACASLGLAALALQEPAAPRLGSGAHVYDWVPAWGQLPGGSSYGNTHGAIVDETYRRDPTTTKGGFVSYYDAMAGQSSTVVARAAARVE